MRENKFRGKRVSFGNWVYGYFWKDIRNSPNNYYIRLLDSSETVEVIPESVGQFTEKIDKNEREIFENDIIHMDGWSPEINIIHWGDGGFGFNNSINGGMLTDIIMITDSTGNHCEVIGNTTDNPELLEV